MLHRPKGLSLALSYLAGSTKHDVILAPLQEVFSKAKDAAGAAVDQAKVGLSKAYDSAKNLVSGSGSGTDKDAKTGEL